jgi:cyclopropane-fatty-acyl-phospholipid synthase
VSVSGAGRSVDRRVVATQRLLERLFATLDVPLIFRLWDGTTVRVGAPGDPPCAVVLRSPAVIRRLLLRPTMLQFGEAYLDGQIDIEGDLFAAMDAAGHVETMRVPLASKLATVAGALRL